MGKLKVYGGWTFSSGKQVRTIVAATSMRSAATLVMVPLSHLRAFWSETGNAKEVETALSEPGRVFKSSSMDSKDFK